MGTGNDCDDFAVAACSLVTSILATTECKNVGLARWIRANVRKAYCVSGMAWPRKKLDEHRNPIMCGHMWCELALQDGSMLVVECTSAVAYYSTTVVCGNARVGDLSEYVERKYYWDSHHGYAVKKGTIGEPLHTNPLPDWIRGLRFHAPDISMDTDYVPPGKPGRPRAITGFDIYRDADVVQVDSNSTKCTKILPFTKACVVWRFAGYTDRTSTFGSYE